MLKEARLSVTAQKMRAEGPGAPGDPASPPGALKATVTLSAVGFAREAACEPGAGEGGGRGAGASDTELPDSTCPQGGRAGSLLPLSRTLTLRPTAPAGSTGRWQRVPRQRLDTKEAAARRWKRRPGGLGKHRRPHGVTTSRLFTSKQRQA